MQKVSREVQRLQDHTRPAYRPQPTFMGPAVSPVMGGSSTTEPTLEGEGKSTGTTNLPSTGLQDKLVEIIMERLVTLTVGELITIAPYLREKICHMREEQIRYPRRETEV